MARNVGWGLNLALVGWGGLVGWFHRDERGIDESSRVPSSQEDGGGSYVGIKLQLAGLALDYLFRACHS